MSAWIYERDVVPFMWWFDEQTCHEKQPYFSFDREANYKCLCVERQAETGVIVCVSHAEVRPNPEPKQRPWPPKGRVEFNVNGDPETRLWIDDGVWYWANKTNLLRINQLSPKEQCAYTAAYKDGEGEVVE